MEKLGGEKSGKWKKSWKFRKWEVKRVGSGESGRWWGVGSGDSGRLREWEVEGVGESGKWINWDVK